MNERCQTCYYYVSYYTKGYDRFNDTHRGFCNKKKNATKQRDGCADWKDNSKKIESRKRLSLQTLQTICEYVRDIRQILQEDINID